MEDQLVTRLKDRRAEIVAHGASRLQAYWEQAGLNDAAVQARTTMTLAVEHVLGEMRQQGDASHHELTGDFQQLLVKPHESAKSTKLANLRLDTWKLIKVLAAATVGVHSSMAVPWTVPLVALTIMMDLRELTTVQVGEREASVLYVLSMNSTNNIWTDSSDALQSVNQARSEDNYRELSKGEFDGALGILQQLGCVEMKLVDGVDQVRLTESIKLE